MLYGKRYSLMVLSYLSVDNPSPIKNKDGSITERPEKNHKIYREAGPTACSISAEPALADAA